MAARSTMCPRMPFELRTVVEPFVCGDAPSEYVIVYLLGCERDRQGSVLMELEKAGECYEPQLKRLARNVLRQRYTDGVIDEMLAPERVSYEDLARVSRRIRSDALSGRQQRQRRPRCLYAPPRNSTTKGANSPRVSYQTTTFLPLSFSASCFEIYAFKGCIR